MPTSPSLPKNPARHAALSCVAKPIQQSRPDPIFFPPQNQPLSRKSPNPRLTRWEIMILKGAPSMQMQTRSLPFTLTPFRFAKSGVFRSVFSCWSVPIGGLNIFASKRNSALPLKFRIVKNALSSPQLASQFTFASFLFAGEIREIRGDPGDPEIRRSGRSGTVTTTPNYETSAIRPPL